MKIFGSVSSLSEFEKLKLASDSSNLDYYFWSDKDNKITGKGLTFGEPQVRWEQVVFIEEQGYIYTKGKLYGAPDLSNLITSEQFASVSTFANNSIQKTTLGKINGQSIEDGDVDLDIDLFVIVDTLPAENINENKIYIKPTPDTVDTKKVNFNEYIWENNSWKLLGVYDAQIPIGDYIKTVDADKRYMKLNNSKSTLSISTNGTFNNYGDNGQAFNAVRNLTNTKWEGNTGSGYPLNAASFGVKDNGTTSFSHKKYDTFNEATGVYTGARNTAVLSFSGNSGLMYAKNTGTSADVTEDMYKYVGVIDSPDANQKVYSAAQVDSLIAKFKVVLGELGATTEQLNSI